MTTSKRCPACSAPMVIRRNRHTDEEFFGCSRYPDCTQTERLPETVKLRRMGAPTLFDEEE